LQFDPTLQKMVTDTRASNKNFLLIKRLIRPRSSGG
jgi:hypothetical protein